MRPCKTCGLALENRQIVCPRCQAEQPTGPKVNAAAREPGRNPAGRVLREIAGAGFGSASFLAPLVGSVALVAVAGIGYWAQGGIGALIAAVCALGLLILAVMEVF